MLREELGLGRSFPLRIQQLPRPAIVPSQRRTSSIGSCCSRVMNSAGSSPVSRRNSASAFSLRCRPAPAGLIAEGMVGWVLNGNGISEQRQLRGLRLDAFQAQMSPLETYS